MCRNRWWKTVMISLIDTNNVQNVEFPLKIDFSTFFFIRECFVLNSFRFELVTAEFIYMCRRHKIQKSCGVSPDFSVWSVRDVSSSMNVTRSSHRYGSNFFEPHTYLWLPSIWLSDCRRYASTYCRIGLCELCRKHPEKITKMPIPSDSVRHIFTFFLLFFSCSIDRGRYKHVRWPPIKQVANKFINMHYDNLVLYAKLSYHECCHIKYIVILFIIPFITNSYHIIFFHRRTNERSNE